MRRIVVFLMSVTVATAALVAPASAQWPDRPIKLIVPFAAGSSSDTIARIVAAKAGEKLGQQFRVEPVPRDAQMLDWLMKPGPVSPEKAYGPAARIICAVSSPLATAASTVPMSRPA